MQGVGQEAASLFFAGYMRPTLMFGVEGSLAIFTGSLGWETQKPGNIIQPYERGVGLDANIFRAFTWSRPKPWISQRNFRVFHST